MSEGGVNRSRRKGDKVSECYFKKQGFFNTKVNFKNAAYCEKNIFSPNHI